MKKILLRLAIVAFWLGAMFWLVRYEAFPGWFAHELPGYRGIFPGGPLILDSWMKVSFQGRPIGYSHTAVDTDERAVESTYLVNNKTVLRLNVMGEMQKVSITAEAALDALYQLQRFYFAMSSGRYMVKVDGRRVGESTFAARMVTPAGSSSTRVDIPNDAIIYSPFLEMSLGRLRPGQQLRVRTLDPASLTTSEVLVEATGHEKLMVMGAEKLATVLEMDFQGMQTKAWVDADGQMLKQETPFGWTMEACSADEAMALDIEKGAAQVDMLRAMAVPVKGDIRQPRTCRELRIRFSGAAIPTNELASDRQVVESVEGHDVILTSRAGRMPPRGTAIGVVPPEFEKYLGATMFIQSDHPDIVREAARITKGITDSAAAARAIHDWVYRSVLKKPTVSLPSALDVLHRMEGDCNEHTYLYVGLARAAGLPAKVRVGLIYNDGAFYYHAWPAVFVGRWIEVDPTLGQQEVDATHIGVLDGELEDQLRLLGLFGNLSAEILSENGQPVEKTP